MRFNKLLEALGTPPLFTVVRVNTLKTTLHDAQQQLQKILAEVCCTNKSGADCLTFAYPGFTNHNIILPAVVN